MIRFVAGGLAALTVTVLGKYIPFCPLGLPPTAAFGVGVGVAIAAGVWAAVRLGWRALLVVAALAAALPGLHAARPRVERLAHALLIALNDDPLADPTNPFLTVAVERHPDRTRFVFFDEPLAGASSLVYSAESTAGLPEGSVDVPIVYDAHWSWQQAERL